MLAKISIGFNIIGGMGLKEPVQELQNALSFNYYANTEIYDERATATDTKSSEALDKYVVEKLGLTLPPVSSAIVNTPQPKKGQSAIGTLAGASSLDYTVLVDELQSNTKAYIDAYFNYMKQIEQQNNFGILQLTNKEVSFNSGKIAEYTTPTDIKIYGKPNNFESLINTLIDRVKNDVSERKDPIMLALKSDSANFKNKTLREVENKLKEIVVNQNGIISNSVNSTINDFVSVEQNLNYTLRKMDVVINKLDGLLIDTNNPLIYDLSGDTFFGDSSSDQSINYVYLNTNQPEGGVASFFKTMESFNTLMDSKINIPTSFNSDESTLNVDAPLGDVGSNAFLNIEDDRFYLVMSQIFTDTTKKDTLFTDLTSGPDVKNEPEIIPAIKETIDEIASRYKTNYDSELKLFSDLEVSEEFVTIKNYVLPSIGKVVDYTTPPTVDVDVKTKKLKDLYSSQNLNSENTFNGKVTFN
jgi:hypothetical protein